MKRLIFGILALICFSAPVMSQTAKSTVPYSAKVTTGLTYQQLLPADQTRHSLTIQNNQVSPSTDNCWIQFSTPNLITAGTTTTATSVTTQNGTMTAAQASIPLTPGQSVTRYWPLVPGDAVFGTCTTTGDSIYVDVQ